MEAPVVIWEVEMMVVIKQKKVRIFQDTFFNRFLEAEEEVEEKKVVVEVSANVGGMFGDDSSDDDDSSGSGSDESD